MGLLRERVQALLVSHFIGITTAYAILALVATALVAVLVAIRAATAVLPGGRGVWDALRRTLTPLALPGAWMVALIATTGSLYMSEVAGLVPCTLCWYQRIAMYPLAVLLGIATVRRELWVARRYLAPLALVGATISIYHYQLERLPDQTSFACGGEMPCNVTLFLRFGFVSLPYMALASFALVVALLLVAHDDRRDDTTRHGLG
jgi:disulfide bond formation protein DsbB